MVSSNLNYPIYIVSKGRHDIAYTARALSDENIPFHMVVEPQEYDRYRENIAEENLIKLPFSNLGLGSFPARNFCWDHSVENGFKKHFIFDDNIRCFSRLNNGMRVKCRAIDALVNLQNFTDRYVNVAISGFNYRYFVTKETKKPFVINTHVYSGMLINNEMPYRWRMKYNEDVDICLQALSGGWSTILLNAYLIDKISTAVKLKGGNQDELYKGNERGKKILKAKSLERIWPQYVKTVVRFNRPHHFVDWKKHFKHGLMKPT